jgi:hypothetical protein
MYQLLIFNAFTSRDDHQPTASDPVLYLKLKQITKPFQMVVYVFGFQQTFELTLNFTRQQ